MARNVSITNSLVIGDATTVADFLKILHATTTTTNVDITKVAIVLTTDKQTITDILKQRKQGNV